MKEYFILERNGLFLACKRKYKRKFFSTEVISDFDVLYMAPYTPAHFKTLKSAKEWFKKILKEDVIHEL